MTDRPASTQKAEIDAVPFCPRCGRATDPDRRHQHRKPFPHEGFPNYLCQPTNPPERTIELSPGAFIEVIDNGDTND